ncbi:response regulator [uncultured Selenomonas sp.]|uniref:response regulator transcription factor n=1 Tax=uncultured Selenomonas sp. TaxID=159275 RepID=UPI0028D7E7F8|nr:response regulator [uncultured Selenomonas sp.]
MYRVLLVEDEDIIRRGLLLSVDWLRAGCVVIGEAVDGEDGLRRIEELSPDIVITDVRMPYLDGLEMLAQSRGRGYEAVILSGYDEFSYARTAISLDVAEYLLKPVDFEALYAALARIRERLQRRDALRRQQQHAAVLPAELLQPSGAGVGKYTGKLLRRIRADYAARLSLRELGEEYGVSEAYLHKCFKQDTNYTFNDFLNRYRIIQAAELLRAGGRKIYEVGACVGFPDYKYFTIVFKKYAGCSPGKFRAQYEGGDSAEE